ncbi:MAG: hypothetical protein EXR47_02040 [Dehalococcoidia bacterium]|nr:hypothetical protein [Dehalococcoidia bacterium]
MAAKSDFLRSVRQAIDKGFRPVPEAPSRPPSRPRPADAIKRADEVRRQLVSRRAEAIATLLKMAPLQAWNVVRVATRVEAADAVAAIAAKLGAKTTVRSDHAVFEDTPVDAALKERGVESHRLTALGRDTRKDLAARAELGVTGVDWMIAETATAVLVSRKGAPRIASLLPPVHVAVVEASQVVPALGDALALVHGQAAAEKWDGFYVNLVSGPSRTGDIEQTIVIGVHGPGQVHLVLIG